MLPNFFYTPEILNYQFGPNHPFKPERLRRTIELLGRYGVEPIYPGDGKVEDLLRVHDERYVEAVRDLSDGKDVWNPYEFGFGSGDNPVFGGMYEAALSYCSATVRAAETVRDGEMLSFGIGGGLHHARRDLASGFCIFDDAAIACHILRERFDRVAYVDIDVHHGDGVQGIFYDDPTVLTCSIHEEGRTLYPGTGWVEETGAEFSSFNVPVQGGTTGDVWLDTFEKTIPLAVEAFGAQAVVLQMGTDTHFLDPLAHVCSTQHFWLEAIREVSNWQLPLVALGGGGYNLATVPRMWVSACLTLGGIPYADEVPSDLAKQWGMPTYSDGEYGETGVGSGHAAITIDWLQREHIPNMRRSK